MYNTYTREGYALPSAFHWYMYTCTYTQHQQRLVEATQMASNRNQLAGYTVEVLELVTRDVQEPFVLPTMVDRIAAMLNYVLKQLVGPKRRQLNVSHLHTHVCYTHTHSTFFHISSGAYSTCMCNSRTKDGEHSTLIWWSENTLKAAEVTFLMFCWLNLALHAWNVLFLPVKRGQPNLSLYPIVSKWLVSMLHLHFAHPLTLPMNVC